MPEGPEIRRAADRIARAVAGNVAHEVVFGLEHLELWEHELSGQTVETVTSRGKGMLTEFSGGLLVYTHNQLYGRWYIKKAGEYPRTHRQLRFAIHTDSKSALLYSASTIEVLAPEELPEHPFFSKLGPDALDPSVTTQEIEDRLEHRRFRNRQLASLLLDQGFVAGLGNYLRCEILHAAKAHPRLRPRDLTPEQIEAIARHCLDLTRQSYQTNGITNDRDRAKRLKAEGMRRRHYRHLAFYRAGEACYQCGDTIVYERHAGRRCERCPTCQPAPT